MPEKIIQYMPGQPARVACDGLCTKAWGISCRPQEQLSDDDNDTVWHADGELGEAPADPGTAEGGHRKPPDASQFPNKWCVRECERCYVSMPGKWEEPAVLPDWSKREYNQPWKHKEGRP